MADALWMRIREVNWDEYAYGGSVKMPSLLKNLASRKLSRAMKTSHQVWTALCGEGKVYPAAIPAVPFLLEIMEISDPAVVDGIIDVFNRMVVEGGEYKDAVAKEKLSLRFYLGVEDQILVEKVKALYEQI